MSIHPLYFGSILCGDYLTRSCQTLFLHRKARASQTVDQDDLDRCAFESSVNATRVVLLQLQADCNQVLMQCERDTESNKVQVRTPKDFKSLRERTPLSRSFPLFQITKLQFYLSEKQKELERVIVDADLRFAERERSFEDQVSERSDVFKFFLFMF